VPVRQDPERELRSRGGLVAREPLPGFSGQTGKNQNEEENPERNPKDTHGEGMVRIRKETGRNPRPVRNPGGVSNIFGFQGACDLPYHFLFTGGNPIKIPPPFFRVILVEKNAARKRTGKRIAVKPGLVNEPSLEPPVKGSLLHSAIGEKAVPFPNSDTLPAHHFGTHQENREERAAENQCDEEAGHNQNNEVHNLREIADHLIDLFFIHGGEEP